MTEGKDARNVVRDVVIEELNKYWKRRFSAEPALSTIAEGASQEIAKLKDLLKRERRTVRQLKHAVKWTLGEVGNFPLRKEGDPPYYFRRPLRAMYAEAMKARAK